MNKVNKQSAVGTKIWIEDMDGNVVFGLGRYWILDMINRLKRLQAVVEVASDEVYDRLMSDQLSQ